MQMAGALHSQGAAPCSNQIQAAPAASWHQVRACKLIAVGLQPGLPEQGVITFDGVSHMSTIYMHVSSGAANYPLWGCPLIQICLCRLWHESPAVLQRLSELLS